MTLLEKLLENCLGNDLTETPFWADGVYRALEQDVVADPSTADLSCTVRVQDTSVLTQ